MVEFNIGDRVTEKGQKRTMSVHKVTENSVTADWFDEEKHLHREIFPKEKLQPAPIDS